MPPRSFAAPPPSFIRRSLSARFGGALILCWIAAAWFGVRLHLPPLAFKAMVVVVAGVWALHVLAVVRHNRRQDFVSPGGRLSGPR